MFCDGRHHLLTFYSFNNFSGLYPAFLSDLLSNSASTKEPSQPSHLCRLRILNRFLIFDAELKRFKEDSECSLLDRFVLCGLVRYKDVSGVLNTHILHRHLLLSLESIVAGLELREFFFEVFNWHIADLTFFSDLLLRFLSLRIDLLGESCIILHQLVDSLH